MPAAYDNNFVVVTVFTQLKVVVVEAGDEPHLILVAATTIETGDELLFDYNDRQSRLQFLKSCPVCGKQPASRKRPAATDKSDADSDVEPDDPVPVTSSDVEPDDPVAGTSEETPLVSQPAPAPPRSNSPKKEADRVSASPPKSKKQKATSTSSGDNPEALASRSDLNKSERERLYRAVQKHFMSVRVLTRSMLEAWLPSITDDNVSRILLRRNMAAANVMVSQIIGN